MNTETDLTPQPDSAPPISGTIKIAGLVLAVVAACGLGLLIFKGIQTRLRAETLLRSEARADSAPSVSIVHPKLGAPTSELILPGSVEAFIETPVYARTNGYLKRWYFDIGARVAAGQLLAEIETPEVDQQLSQARAELNTARANFELARSTADRWQFLQKTDSVSRQETDEKLGDLRAKSAMHINTEVDAKSGALYARNQYSTEFSDRLAFFDVDDRARTVSGDRREFIGRNGGLAAPAALAANVQLSNRGGAGLDPCAAIQLHVDLAPGAIEEVFFLIGEGMDRAESLALIQQIQVPGEVEHLWQAVQQHWDDILNVITVETPDPGMDLMLNRWLLYQTISCRLWGRSALYQSSGAFGFRDQLQDVLAVLHARPALAREHILNAARRQFEAGDVLHWWHPITETGLETKMTDDLLWLPFIVSYYLQETGDYAFLEKREPYYGAPDSSATIFEHCVAAIEKVYTRFNERGIPLIGAGDWNDYLQAVGLEAVRAELGAAIVGALACEQQGCHK